MATVRTMRCLAAAAAVMRGAAALSADLAARCLVAASRAGCLRAAGGASGGVPATASGRCAFAAPGVPCSSALRLRTARGARAAAKSTCAANACVEHASAMVVDQMEPCFELKQLSGRRTAKAITLSLRPPRLVPFSCCTAAAASSRSANCT